MKLKQPTGRGHASSQDTGGVKFYSGVLVERKKTISNNQSSKYKRSKTRAANSEKVIQ